MKYQLNYLYVLKSIETNPNCTVKAILSDFNRLSAKLQAEIGLWKQRDLYRVLRQLGGEGMIMINRPKRQAAYCIYQITEKGKAALTLARWCLDHR